MTQLESIACNNCGAPLQVPAGANFVTCNHCHTSLAIRRGDSTTYTEKIEKIDERTEHMASELAQLRYESELARIDREWEQERQGYLVRGQNGKTYEPNVGGSVFIGVFATVAGFIWMAIASQIAGAFALFGIVFIGVGLVGAMYSYSKANALVLARQRYQRRRRQLSVEQFLKDESAESQAG